MLEFLLLMTFVGLKLTGVITWSWWWVTSPVWISVILGLSIEAANAVLLARGPRA